jgi:fucose permease
LGRSIAPALRRRFSEIWISRIGLLIALFGVFGALAAYDTIQLAITTCFAGLGLSAVYPIAIALLSQKFGPTASQVGGGLMFNLAGLGGATLPCIVGVTSNSLNSLKAGLFVPLIGGLTMLLLHFCIKQQEHRTD